MDGRRIASEVGSGDREEAESPEAGAGEKASSARSALLALRRFGSDGALALVFGMLVGIVLSVSCAFYATDGLMSFADASVWLSGIGYGVVAALLLFALLRWWAWFQGRSQGAGRLARALRGMKSQQRVILFAGISVLAWIPALLAYFPGGYSSDGPIQATYYFNTGVVDLHWPAAHTLLLVAAMQVGSAVFGSYDAGVTLFCAAQMVAAAFAAGYAMNRVIAWKAPAWLAVASFAALVLNPVVQSYVVATAKDTLFAVFFLVVLVLFIDALRGCKSWSNPGFLCAFVLCALGMTLMRKQGLYVLIVAIAVAAFVGMRGKLPRACALGGLVAVYALSSCFSYAVEAAFTVRSDSVREILSLPSQQIVRTYMYDYDELSEAQVSAIGRYYDLESLEAGRTTDDPWDDTPIGQYCDAKRVTGYLAPVSDPAKGALLDEAFSEDPLGYAILYLSLMDGHESQYARAFLWSVLGYLYPSASVANTWSVLSPWNEFGLTIDAGGESNQVSDFHDATLLPGYLSWLEGASTTLGEGNPLLSLWVCPAFPFYALLLAFLLIVRAPRGCGRRAMLVAWLFLLVYGASLALAPVVCLRYAVPLIFCIPVIVGMPFSLRAKVDAGRFRGIEVRQPSQ